MRLTKTQWRMGEIASPSVAQTFTVIDPVVTAKLVTLIRAGCWLTRRHARPDGALAVPRFALRGSTAALNAAQAQIAAHR